MNLARRLTGPGILRFYLASAVVSQHLGAPLIGSMCVLIFFVLSGYWICGLWETKYRLCRRPYLTFMLSRYWRLLPVYLLCVFLAGLCIWRFSGWWGSWTTHFNNARWMLGTFFILGCASQPRFVVPAWSLDVEMQFYLIAPLVIALTAPMGGCKVKWGLLGVLCVAGFMLLPLGTTVPGYLLFFVTGCALARARWNPPLPAVLVCSALALAIFAGAVWAGVGRESATHAIQDGMDVRLASLACVGLLVPFVALSLRRRSDSLDRSLGDLAYPIYLFHFIPQLALDHIRATHNASVPVRDILDILCVAAGAAAIYFLVDRPLDRRRREYIERQVILGREVAAEGVGADA